MTPALLTTQNLTKRYGGLVANDSVAMSIGRGEIRGLIGPNGAGKTTFVNLVTGIETPDAGNVRLGNRDLAGLPPHVIADAGLVRSFQVARVFGTLTTLENLMVPYFARAAVSPATTPGTPDAVGPTTLRSVSWYTSRSIDVFAAAIAWLITPAFASGKVCTFTCPAGSSEPVVATGSAS